eukprot:6613938-Prymnesium_polylepis.1
MTHAAPWQRGGPRQRCVTAWSLVGALQMQFGFGLVLLAFAIRPISFRLLRSVDGSSHAMAQLSQSGCYLATGTD